MADASQHWRLAASYLEDAAQARADMVPLPKERYFRGDVERIMNGDVALARKEIDALEAAGVDVSELRALAFCEEGMLWWALTNGWRISEATADWQRAAAAFEQSVRLKPRTYTCHNLALVYESLGRDSDALEMYKQAAALSDGPEGIEALKQAGRVEARLRQAPVRPGGNTSSSPLPAVLFLVSAALAVLAFMFVKNAAGQRMWHIPMEILVVGAIVAAWVARVGKRR